MKAPILRTMPVKQANGEQFIEGVSTAWAIGGVEFVITAPTLDELEAIVENLPGGESYEPQRVRRLKLVDMGRLQSSDK